jgi:hypothetical protein
MLCSRVQNLLSAYCDREMTGAEMLQIREHLRNCASCEQERRQILQIKQVLGALGPADPIRAFDPARLSAAPGVPWWVRTLGITLPAQHPRRAAVSVYAPPRLSPSGRLGSSLAACALVIGAFLFGVLQSPQPSDAVTAQIPPSLAVETDLRAAVDPGFVNPMPEGPLPFHPASYGGQVYRASEPFFQVGPPAGAQASLFLSSSTSWRKVDSR